MKTETITIGNKKIRFETGEIARQASGAVVVRQENTVVLVTVVAAAKENKDIDFFPLSVEYRERVAAAGKFPGGFVKRETRPQEHEILASRLIDRSIRPLFPESFRCETQIMATVLSYSPEAQPESLAILGAAAALHLSDIPWNGPLGGVNIVGDNNKLILFPDSSERQKGTALDLMISCSKQGLVMLEGIADQISEDQLLQAIELAQSSLAPFFELLDHWRNQNDLPKRQCPEISLDPGLEREVEQAASVELRQAIVVTDKKQRSQNIRAVYDKISADFQEKYPEHSDQIIQVLDQLQYRIFRRYLLEENKRVDGRDFDQVRPISGRVAWLPQTHGSSIFTRGETQALVSCTLGTSDDEQVVETLSGITRQKFMLHYNFPPYSVGEVRAIRGPGRREIGHGYLATRALRNILPNEDDFPYTIRLVSDISESNGSSSMASVCGGCLALMDAGVPIKKPAAGVAMGLIKESDRIIVLSDIIGAEDHLGDMDFKVTGTDSGITAVQMDNKIGSLPQPVLQQALEQARQARLHILQEMAKILKQPRLEISPLAPRVYSLTIRKERIRDLIGPGGKVIQEIQERNKVKIDIDSLTGKVKIYSANELLAKEALKQVRQLTQEAEVGKCYRGEVISIKSFGAFVRLFTNVEGLLHISELSDRRVNQVTEVVREGDKVVVRVLGVDRQGKIRLSRKEALNVPESEIEE